jgi:hypothetical protein
MTDLGPRLLTKSPLAIWTVRSMAEIWASCWTGRGAQAGVQPVSVVGCVARDYDRDGLGAAQGRAPAPAGLGLEGRGPAGLRGVWY